MTFQKVKLNPENIEKMDNKNKSFMPQLLI